MFMTPRGLKIRIEIPMGFTLLARIWKTNPDTDAFRILKTVEALEHIPSITAFIGAFFGLFYGSAWWHVAIGIIVGKLFGKLLTTFGVFVIPGAISLAVMWSWVSGYGLLTLIGITIAWMLEGWEFAAGWITGIIIAYFISDWAIELSRMKYYNNKLGYPLTQAEVNFFNAYRLHADRLNITNSIKVSEDEIQSNDWQRCLDDYADKYPEAVARFL